MRFRVDRGTRRRSRAAPRPLVLSLLTGVAVGLVAEPARAQSPSEERARTYMLDHCLEITAKEIDPEVPMTLGLKSGESIRASFVRAQGDTLVVRLLAGEDSDWATSTFAKEQVASLRYTNRPWHSWGRGILGFVVGYTVSGLAMLTILEATEYELEAGGVVLVVGGVAVGSAVGFAIGYNSTMKHPGESTIVCR